MYWLVIEFKFQDGIIKKDSYFFGDNLEDAIKAANDVSNQIKNYIDGLSLDVYVDFNGVGYIYMDYDGVDLAEIVVRLYGADDVKKYYEHTTED